MAGRPAYQPSDKDRRCIIRMIARGCPQNEVAEAIGLDLKTLRKHFRDELDRGYRIAKDLLDDAVWTLALGAAAEFDGKGNQIRSEVRRTLGAITWLEKTRFGVSEYDPKPRDPTPLREEPMGKKEARMRDAQTADQGTVWADLLMRRDKAREDPVEH